VFAAGGGEFFGGGDRRGIVAYRAAAARPHEIASLRVCDVRASYTRVDFLAKGGWYKPTPLSPQMAPLLRSHCESLPPEADQCFYNSRGKPVTVSWIQRMVRAGLHQRTWQGP